MNLLNMNITDSLATYSIEGEDFLWLEELKERYHPYFHHPSKSDREIIRYNNLMYDLHYVIARNPSNWTVTPLEEYSKRVDKYMILKGWLVRQHMHFGYPGMKEIIMRPIYEQKKQRDSAKNNTLAKFSLAPQALVLTENEKFRDNKSNTIEVDIRGQRDGIIYINVGHLTDILNIKFLKIRIPRKDSEYVQGEDYEIFVVPDELGNLTRTLYVTCQGLLKATYTSRTAKTNAFKTWVNTLVQTTKFGTPQAKLELFSNIMGLDEQGVRAAFMYCGFKVSGVYFVSIGYVRDIRSLLDIPSEKWIDIDGSFKKGFSDDMVAVKFGMTDDIEGRYLDHAKTYSYEKGYDPRLACYFATHPDDESTIETTIKHHFLKSGMKLANKEHTEIAIMTLQQAATIKLAFSKIIGKSSIKNPTVQRICGMQEHVASAINSSELKEANDKATIALLNEKISNMEKSHAKDLAMKDKDLAMKDNDLSTKDREIEYLKDNHAKDMIIKDMLIQNAKLVNQ